MSFFSDIAWTAHRRGKRAKEFEEASHRHGTAFWFYLIVAGVVWHFTSWRWALIPLALVAWSVWNAIASGLVRQHMETLEKLTEGTPPPAT